MNHKLYLLIIIIPLSIFLINDIRNKNSHEIVLNKPITLDDKDIYNKKGINNNISPSYDIFLPLYKDDIENANNKIIAANLDEKKINILENGQIIKTFPIVSIGKPDKYYETPGGVYKIKGWETEHYSSLGHVYMPWSMQFSGNYFIHGIPYHDMGNGTKDRVSTEYSGGCIRLADDDAKYIYDFSDKDTVVIVSKIEDRADLPIRSDTSSPSDSTLKEKNRGLSDLENKYSNKQYFIMDLSTNVYTTNIDETIIRNESINNTNIYNLAIAYTSLDNVSQERKVLYRDNNVKMLSVLGDTLAGDAEAISLSIDYIGPRLFQAYLNNKLKAIGAIHTEVNIKTQLSTTTFMDMVILSRYTYIYKPYIMSIDDSAGTGNIWQYNMGQGYYVYIVKGVHRDFLVLVK